jgi:acetoin utilization protein AcuC
MGKAAAVVWDESFLGYDLGGDHPLNPVRLDLTIRLATALGVLEVVEAIVPELAGHADIERVHAPGYLSAVQAAPTAGWDVGHGLGTADNPVFDRMHEASALVTGGTVDAARAVRAAETQHAVNLAGGLHHAMPAAASGFCVYNDAAVAIAWLLADGVGKVAYVDLDAHHGDGVQAAFFDDPRVLTISLHESGYTAFPGTGFPHERGTGKAEGMAVNVALPANTGDAGWLRAFHAVVPPLIRAFEPHVLVTQLGCDSHRLDPLAQLNLSVDAHRHSYSELHALAHEVAGGRWIAVGGGGYEIVRVVPLSWTHVLAEAADAALDPHAETPEAWRRVVHERTGREAPPTLTDGADLRYRPWDAGEGDPDDPLDRAIAATRRAVFPEHGLDPLDPR